MIDKSKLRRATITMTCGGFKQVIVAGSPRATTQVQVSIKDDETSNIINLDNLHLEPNDVVTIPIWYEDTKGKGAKRGD